VPEKLIIKLTKEQQKQIKDATGKTIAKLNIDTAATRPISDEELDQVAGGVVPLTFGREKQPKGKSGF